MESAATPYSLVYKEPCDVDVGKISAGRSRNCCARNSPNSYVCRRWHAQGCCTQRCFLRNAGRASSLLDAPVRGNGGTVLRDWGSTYLCADRPLEAAS